MRILERSEVFLFLSDLSFGEARWIVAQQLHFPLPLWFAASGSISCRNESWRRKSSDLGLFVEIMFELGIWKEKHVCNSLFVYIYYIYIFLFCTCIFQHIGQISIGFWKSDLDQQALKADHQTTLSPLAPSDFIQRFFFVCVSFHTTILKHTCHISYIYIMCVLKPTPDDSECFFLIL